MKYTHKIENRRSPEESFVRREDRRQRDLKRREARKGKLFLQRQWEQQLLNKEEEVASSWQ